MDDVMKGEKIMKYYYYVVCNKNPTYTITSKKPITKDDLGDKDAKYLVPISLCEWVYMAIKFKNRKERY